MDKNRAKEKLIVVNFKAGSDNYVKLVGGGTIYADDFSCWADEAVDFFYDGRYTCRIPLKLIKEVL
jgi:hypothetical protein